MLYQVFTVEQLQPDYVVYIATCDAPFDAFARISRTSYAWIVTDLQGKFIRGDCSGLKAAPFGHHTDELVRRLIDAIRDVPSKSLGHVISDVDFFVDLLNEGIEGRIQRGYKKTNGKPLAYQEDWRKLDQLILSGDLYVQAARPHTDSESLKLRKLKDQAMENAKNIDKSPGEWNVE